MGTTTGNLGLFTIESTQTVGDFVSMVSGQPDNMQDIDTAITALQSGDFTALSQETAIEHYSSAVEGIIREFIAQGRTLRNFADNGLNYANWVVDSGSSTGANGITLVANGGNDSAILSTNLSTSTQYTFFILVSSSTTTSSQALRLVDLTSTATDGTASVGSSVGLHKFTASTKSTITNNRILFSIDNAETNGNTVVFTVLAILEGDETSQDIESELAFGLNSVGTSITLPDGSSGYKMEILTTGKNLLQLPTGSISNNGVTISRNGSKISINGTSTGISRINLNLTFSNEDNFNNIPINFPSVTVNDNTDYTVNFSNITGSYSSGGTPTFSIINQTNVVLLSKTLGQTTSSSINTSSNDTVWIYLFIASGTTFNNYEFDIQVEQGTTATDFEPHVSNKTEILSSNPWREAGNNVKDELRVINGETTTLRRVGVRAYQSGDENNSAFITDLTNTNYPLATTTTETHLNTPQITTFTPTTLQLQNNIKPTITGNYPSSAGTTAVSTFDMALNNQKQINDIAPIIEALGDIALLGSNPTNAEIATKINQILNVFR